MICDFKLLIWQHISGNGFSSKMKNFFPLCSFRQVKVQSKHLNVFELLQFLSKANCEQCDPDSDTFFHTEESRVHVFSSRSHLLR